VFPVCPFLPGLCADILGTLVRQRRRAHRLVSLAQNFSQRRRVFRKLHVHVRRKCESMTGQHRLVPLAQNFSLSWSMHAQSQRAVCQWPPRLSLTERIRLNERRLSNNVHCRGQENKIQLIYLGSFVSISSVFGATLAFFFGFLLRPKTKKSCKSVR